MNRFEPWLLRWVALPLLVAFAIVAGISVGSAERKCQRIAEEKGFVEGIYKPGMRAGIGATCTCVGKIMPDGSINEEHRIEIDWDVAKRMKN